MKDVMKPILFFATRVRALKKPLLENKNLDFEFAYNEQKIQHGGTSLKNKILSKLIRSRIFDLLGVIQTVKPPKGYEFYGSENRFLNVDKPYFIHVENPTALYHYCLRRNKTLLGKRKVNRSLSNPNLRALVFWSKKTGETFEKVCGKIPEHVYRTTIYNLVPANHFVSTELITQNSRREKLRLLYCVQGIRFFSKGGLEVLEAYRRLTQYNTIQLTIITNLDIIGEKLCDEIRSLDINLMDFKLSKEEMQKVYADSDILLQPTSDDSFGLTFLEAMKAGCAILGSRLYAVPEMVKEGENGFLTAPAYWFFYPDGTPNPAVWNHRKSTIYSRKICNSIVDFFVEKIQLLNNDRDLLERMCLRSYDIANSSPFDEQTIVAQWNKVFEKMKM